MSEHFNQLTPAEVERLSIIIEECAEVQHIACKILRHGYESSNPLKSPATPNRTLLTEEIGHLRYAILLMNVNEDYDFDQSTRFMNLKRDSLRQYLHHQRIL